MTTFHESWADVDCSGAAVASVLSAPICFALGWNVLGMAAAVCFGLSLAAGLAFTESSHDRRESAGEDR